MPATPTADYAPRVLPALLCLLLLSGTGAADSERGRHEQRLQHLRGEIAEVEKRLTARALEKSAALNQLRETELQLAGLAQQIATLRSQLTTHERDLADLRKRRARLQEELGVHQHSLRQQVVAAHRVGRMQVVQLLLNQQDPGLVSRVMTYAGYLNRARVSAIDTTRGAVSELNDVLARIERARAALNESRTALLRQQSALQANRKERAELVAEMEQQLASGGRRLAQLREDSARLEELLRSLQELLVDIPDAPLEHNPFRKLKGKLPWPAKGKIAKRYNSPRGIGDMKWRGMLIAAPNGNNVRAVYHGQVVFADWLPGLGLLTIIDHEDGYMSLYGYNQSLLKDTGDWVEPGEIIATVGDSGGQSNSGVYFEIREDGKPINPHRWLTRRFSQAS